MNSESLINVVVLLALLVFVGVRQLRWSPLVESKLWRMPVILGAIGVFTIAKSVSASSVTTFDIALLVVELVISVAIGCLMGVITRIRHLENPTETARLESSTGWIGLVLWVVYIAFRVGFGIWAGHMGSELGTSTGVILVMVAANRASRAGVLAVRLARIPSAVAHSSIA